MFRQCKACGLIKLWLRFWVRRWHVQGYPFSERTFLCNTCVRAKWDNAGYEAVDKFRKEKS